MDMVRRAYLQAVKKEPKSIDELHQEMIRSMVWWIKKRVYLKRDWPSELGEYPKHLEKEIG